jgi:hypothetical protein
MLSMFRPHVADPNDQNQGLPSSGGLTTDNPDDPLALGGGDEGSNGSGDFDGSQDEPQTGLEWNDDSGDEGSLPHKEPKKADTTTLSHRSRESSKEPMQVDETGPSLSSISSSALAHGGEDDQEEDEVMESSTDVGSSSKSSNVPPQVQSRTLLDWTMTDEDGADASEPGMGDNSNNASTTGSPDPEASLWIFGGLIHSFKSAYETDPASQETLLTFQKVCEVYEAGVGVESANMAQMFGQEICVFARKCNVPESYAVVRNRSKPFFNGRRAQDQDESMEEDAGVMGALMNCLWRITKKEGRQGAERVAQMLSNCEATVEPSSRLLSMWYLIGLVHGYRNCTSSGAPIILEDALSLYGSYLQNAAERDLAQTPAEDGADMDQEERAKSVVQEYLVRDLQNLQDRQITVFDAIVPLVLQHLSDYIPRTESFLRMVIFLATPTQIYYLSLGLSQRQFPLFSSLSLDDGALAKDKDKKKNNVQENRGSPRSIQSSLVSGWEPRVGTETLEVIRQTLEWGTFDQMGIWQLIVSEFGGVLKAITGLLSASWVPSMTSDSQAEALGGLLNLIRTLSLSPPDIRLGTTIVRIASRTDIVSYDMVQLCQSWIGQSASTYPDHLGAILLSLSDKTAAPIWEELHGLDLGSPSSSVPTTPTPKATRSKIGSSSQSKRPKLTVKQRKEQGTMLRTALSLIRGWCETFSVEVTQQHFLRVWSAQVRSQVLDALTENFGVNEKEAWPKDWWIEDEGSVSQNDEDMENRHSEEDDDEDTDDKEDDGDDDEEGGRGNTNSSSRKKKMSEDEEEDESDQDQQSSDSDRRKKDKKRFGGAASGSASSSRRNSPKIGSGSSSTMGSNASTPTASKKGAFAGVLNSKSRSTRATVASTKKTTPARKAAASRRRKISEDDDDEEEEEDAQDDDEEEEEEEEEEKESQDEMDEDEKSEKNGEEESNDEESEEETKGKKGKGKRPAKKVAAPATPAKRAATTRSQVKKPAVKPLTRSNRRTRKQEEEEDEDDEEDEDEDGEKEKDDDEEEDDNEGNEGAEDEDEDDDEEEEEEETLKKGKLPVYTQRRAAANANSKLLAGKGASAAATSSASKAKAAPKSRAKNKRRIVTDDESE